MVKIWSKNLLTNQNAAFFKLQYITNELRYEVEFFYLIRHPWTQQILVGCLKWVWSGMPQHVKVTTVMSLLYLKNELVMKSIFCVWLGINKSNKLILSLQVGVIKCSQSHSKQWDWMNVSMKLIRMNLVMKLIFSVWLGIYKHISLIQSIHMAVVKHTWAFQK